MKNCLTYNCQARFSKAVVATSVFVHLSSDGDPYPGYSPSMISLKLIGLNGEIHDQPLVSLAALCNENPVQFVMTHDLNLPFFHTKEVNNNCQITTWIRFNCSACSPPVYQIRMSLRRVVRRDKHKEGGSNHRDQTGSSRSQHSSKNV